MTREEAARRYLESSRAASAAGRGSERESIEHDTQERLRRRHPGVHEHALVGADEDFDQPLARNEREHQRHLQKQAGLTNPQLRARRAQLRSSDYGRHKPSEIYQAANPQPPAAGSRPRRGRGHVQPRGRGTGRQARQAAQAVANATPGSSIGSILGEFALAGVGLSVLYLVLSNSSVTTGTLNGITGFFRRLIEPTNDLFSTAAKATTSAKAKAAPTGLVREASLRHGEAAFAPSKSFPLLSTIP
jgi:hypothetical protein